MKSTNRWISYIGALCLIVGSGAARAQSSHDQEQTSRSENRNAQQTIRGTIDSVRQADWASSDDGREQRCIVRLQLENGRTEFVDVGSQSKLRNMDLNSGDQIQLKGSYTTVDGRRVFLADQIRVDGKTFTLQRNAENQSSQFAQDRSARSDRPAQTVQGTIQGFHHIYLRPSQGRREQHSLVKLRLQDGRTLVVDLGRKKDLDDLDLQQGDKITLHGRQGTIDGRSVFFADRVRAGGQTLRIARNGSGENQGQTSDNSNSGQEGKDFTLRGKVAGYQVITLQSGQKQVSLLNLTLEDGRSVVIDAGQKRGELDLKDLDVRDRAVIKGHTENLNGRQVLVADSVQFLEPQNSQPSAVGRSGQDQRSSGSGSSSGQNQGKQSSQDQE
jgi:hypothetical protein